MMHSALLLSKNMTISAILLAGGLGRRLGGPTPKQYLFLNDRPIVLHALDALLQFRDWKEIVVVCDPIYIPVFSSYKHLPLLFALPGKTRQESLFSGYDTLKSPSNWICVHDGARPLLQKKDLLALIEAGKTYNAATLAVPVKTTLKEADKNLFVKKTLDRSMLWDIQTPQVLTSALFEEGRDLVLQKNIDVTDDVSLAEALSAKVKIVEGSYSNIKITTEEDLSVVKMLFERLHG